MDSELPEDKGKLTRRTVLVAGGAAVTAVGVGGVLSANASAQEAGPAAASPTADTCYQLTSELVEGPYYIDADKLRRDVTEDQEGIPLALDLTVIDADTCRPLRNAAVDIWHCNATGVYSGYEAGGGGGPAPTGPPPSGTPTGTPTGGPPGGGGGHQEPTDDDRFLRGTWHTDRHGHVTFRTVFPAGTRAAASTSTSRSTSTAPGRTRATRAATPATRASSSSTRSRSSRRRSSNRTSPTPRPARPSPRTASTPRTATRAVCSTSSTTDAGSAGAYARA